MPMTDPWDWYIYVPLYICHKNQPIVYSPYAPIPSASRFGVGFGYLNTF